MTLVSEYIHWNWIEGFLFTSYLSTDFPGGWDGKESAFKSGDLGSIPVLGRSPGEGNGNPPQYSCLGNFMDWGAWWAAVHGFAKRWTQLSNWYFHTSYFKGLGSFKDSQPWCYWTFESNDYLFWRALLGVQQYPWPRY